MKKLLLSCIALAASSLAFAETFTINFADEFGSTTIDLATSYTWEGITFETAKNSSSSKPAYNKAGDIRLYAANTLTLSTTNGSSITKVEFAISSQGLKRLTDVTPSEGTIVEQGANPVVWTGSASSVTFTVGDKATYGTDGASKAGQLDFDSMTVTLGDAPAVIVPVPVITPESGTYGSAQTVTISAEDGCSVYYTTDGSAPTAESTPYTEPFSVSEDCTVKAVAADAEGNLSSTVTATYKFVVLLDGAEGEGTEASPYNPVGAYNAALLGSTGEVYVSGVVSQVVAFVESYGEINYYISADGTEVNQLYLYNGLGLNGAEFASIDDLKVGDKVVVKGNLTTYKGVPQLARGNQLVSLNGEEAPVTPEPELEGEGTQANPYTVTDVITLNTQAGTEKVWVRGYIIGYLKGQSFSNDAVFNVDECTVNTNILIAATPECTDPDLCVPVQLPTGDVRNALNLQDHPENLGKEVDLYGLLQKYFSVAGLKSVSSYKFDSSSLVSNLIDQEAPAVYFDLNGVRVSNPVKGIYIKRQGNKTVKVGF